MTQLGHFFGTFRDDCSTCASPTGTLTSHEDEDMDRDENEYEYENENENVDQNDEGA